MTLLFFLIGTTLAADVSQNVSPNRRQEALNSLKQDPHSLPGFYGESGDIAFDIHDAERGTKSVLESNPHARHISETAQNRPFFKLDPLKDPIMIHSMDAALRPEAFLAKPISNRIPDQGTRHTCDEGRPQRTVSCVKTLVPQTFILTPARYSHWWCTSGRHGPDDPRCRAKKYYSPARMVTPEKIKLEEERWISTCQGLEEQTRLGRCRLIQKTCPKGPETLELQGSMNGKPTSRKVTVPCTRYEMRYACGNPKSSPCDALRKRGCTQVMSRCLDQKGPQDPCTRWRQTFICDKRTPQKIGEAFGTITPGTLPSSSPNSGMAAALAQLQLLKEVQDDLRSQNQATTLPLIFKGQARFCTIAFGKFKNCCTDGKGWGVSLGLAGCNGEEKDLAQRQQKGLCHVVGTFCAEKILGVCVRKKRSACCFGTKLARILQEQGRAQLGLSWGASKEPDCRGLAADELSRINFDRLDLSEAFADILSRTKTKPCSVVQRNISTSIMNMTQKGEEEG